MNSVFIRGGIVNVEPSRIFMTDLFTINFFLYFDSSKELILLLKEISYIVGF